MIDVTCKISMDREGNWFANGSPVTNENIALYFARHIAKDSNGNIVLQTDRQVFPLYVEDTPFIVKHCLIIEELNHKIKVSLNDNTTEIIDWDTVWLQGEHDLYCLVKGGQFEARFNRNSQYELGQLLEIDEHTGQYYCVMNGVRHDLAIKQD